jgi:hypothetical protein
LIVITYCCDRCRIATTPEDLYEVEVIFTPYDADGGQDVDKEERIGFGQACGDCTKIIESQVRTLVAPLPCRDEAQAPASERQAEQP